MDTARAVRYLAPMNRRITIFFVFAVALVFPTLAAAKAPTIQSFKIYRTPSGPDKGAITVISTLDYRGFAKAADFPKGAVPPVSRAIVTLTGTNAAITARDVMRLHPRTRDGAPVRFDFRIPATKARAIADRKIKVAFAVSLNGRTSKFVTKTARTTRQLFGGFCLFGGCQANPSPPPAPSVAFGQSPSFPALCINFNGIEYAAPYLYPIQVADATGNSVWGSFGNSITAYAVRADGTFSAQGFEQPAANPGPGDVNVTLSGAVPASVLTATPAADTGAAVLYDSGAPFGQIPNPVVAPYQSNNDWC